MEAKFESLKRAEGIRKFTGLMFRTKNTSPLLFEFEREMNLPIHSWFVLFPFEIIWYSKNNKIIERRIVYPFEKDIKPNEPYTSFIEIPMNK